MRIGYVVTDQRSVQSLAFGAALVDQGAERLELTDGLTRLWRDNLVPLWKGKSGAVAGLTLTQTWAGLAEQARSAGRRSVLVGHHFLVEGGGAATHSMSLTRPTPGLVPLLERFGEAWPQALAKFSARYPTGDRRTPDACHGRAPVASASVVQILTSWIIA